MKKSVDYKRGAIILFALLFVFFSLLNIIIIINFFSFTPSSITGFSSLGSLSLIIEEWRFINITTPLNTTYNFESTGNYLLYLNVTSNFDVDSWWYDLIDLQSNVIVNKSISFIPNTTINAVRYSNKLIVYGNRTDNAIINDSIVFYVNISNTAPIIGNINSDIYVCENQWLSYYFNVSDVDGDVPTESMVPLNPFYVAYAYNVDSITNAYEIFSGILAKSNAGGINGQSQIYEETISVSDGVFSDSAMVNITVIEINNAPVISTIGVQTIWTIGENSTFNYQVQVTDVESGDQDSGNLTFNLTFPSEVLFNITSNGTMILSPDSSQVGVYDIEVCVSDIGLLSPHANISLCGQDGGSRTSCQNFSLTITNANREPVIESYSPTNLVFNLSGTETISFNMSESDADGTIPDAYWYVNGIFKEIDVGSLIDEFDYSFGCGVSGEYTVKGLITDGDANDSIQWNITVLFVECPLITPSFGGGGIIGGGRIIACGEKWGCEEWTQCRNFNEFGFELNFELREAIKERCLLFDLGKDICGFQLRNCTDINKCGTNFSKPGIVRECHYTKSPNCNDGIRNCHNGSCEVLIDCGGPCNPCPTCSDGIQNQNEEGIDCGGPCPSCIKEWPLKFKNISIYTSITLFIISIIFIIWLFILYYKNKKRKKEISEKYKRTR